MLTYEKDKELSEINVTPFIDVMLVLLIIFMVVAPLATASVKVELPSVASKSTSDEKDPTIIYINDKHEIYVGNKLANSENLISFLDQKTNNNKNDIVYFHIDKSVSYEILMKTIENVKNANYSKIALTSGIDKSANE
ncbi:Ferric siderophore transport system, biopolymer transport protein ExbD [Campylobacter sputorum subsp. bubulus]|uniref:Ferric siderophore transport system, biopolymer transport protein ExbD n=1 Tax=Campylobacter sputorum subsp. sputorum TaxID=32024 RepID=A0A381DK37_9BACT|nr:MULTISPECIES: biopolymer transporter ExbD [Campylobacter]ASM34402.1 TonB system transport protein ExbD [Campylobacter sputorum aubsp. sputorum RM3237]ASM36070.1 TonB system transport protein ExbD [Campylobacter sputorum bv. faecalis CCUG 20703]ASM37750.1 TonB system transport protein ExbD [Campylobacter sputorum bv. paraureolyticus LMG 11764]KAB0582209.1 biopolymer transporter ExbD [Campylobacter sputorum subsp. sputorum]MBE7358265.1 biopolymer transporter ExbD [Campylobacter sp. RM11302]